MITSSIPFPSIYWWKMAIISKNITIDLEENYQKMSFRNRYYLAAPEGKMLMSIPLENGRNQRIAVSNVGISNQTNWQYTHWKTITSLYNRSPFFEYFEPYFISLFEKKFDLLHEFNMAGITLVNKLLQLNLSFSTTDVFLRNYDTDIIDLRTQLKPQTQYASEIKYYQVFEDRCGFQPNCSILDLIFNEGLAAVSLLR